MATSQYLPAVEDSAQFAPAPERVLVGWPLWFQIWYALRQAICLATGGHRADDPLAYMKCSRCPGTLYEKTFTEVARPLSPSRLWWGQVNRYRDWIRPWALAHPRLAAVVGLCACPRCDFIFPAHYQGDCDTCSLLASKDWA